MGNVDCVIVGLEVELCVSVGVVVGVGVKVGDLEMIKNHEHFIVKVVVGEGVDVCVGV